MPSLIDKLLYTSFASINLLFLAFVISWMLSDMTKHWLAETAFTIFFFLLLASPLVTIILFIVSIWA